MVFFDQLHQNLSQLFPEYRDFFNIKMQPGDIAPGWCVGLTWMWLQALWSKGEEEFHNRLLLLGSGQPIFLDGVEYKNFQQIQAAHEQNKTTKKYPELDRFMVNARAFMDSVFIYQDPIKTFCAPMSHDKIQRLVFLIQNLLY